MNNKDSHKTINFAKISKIQVSVEGILIRKQNEIHKENNNLKTNRYYYNLLKPNYRLSLEKLIKSSENKRGQLNYFNPRKIFTDYSLNKEYIELNSKIKNNKSDTKNINFNPFINNQFLGNKQKREVKKKNNIINNKREQIKENKIKNQKEDKSNNTSPSSNNVDLDQINQKVNLFI